VKKGGRHIFLLLRNEKYWQFLHLLVPGYLIGAVWYLRFYSSSLLARFYRMALRQGQPPHTCFYSNKCEWSEAFLKELSATPYKSEFHFVCIDTTPRSQLPTWLKQVPTLLIKGADEPVKVGGDVMNWMYERKMGDTNRVSPPSGNRGQSNSQNSNSGSGAGAEEPEAWNISEMGGKLSESYGNLINGSGASVESSSSKNFDFAFLNGNAATGEKSGQGMGMSGQDGGGSKKSKKEDLLNKQLESYQRNRDIGIPNLRPRQAPM
jgi:hypothetical protein